MAEPRQHSIRFLLLLLAACGLLPLALASGAGLILLDSHHRSQTERLGIDTARALNTAVDAELQRAVSVLQALAGTAALESGDVDVFRVHALRVMSAQPNWMLIALASPEGEQLLNTRVERGEKPPPVVEPDSLNQVVRERAPVIGFLQRGRAGNYAVPVRVPVTTGGALRYVLSAVVRPDTFLDVVSRQKVREDWVISIFDARSTRVARSRAHEQSLGTPASPTLQQLAGRSNEAWGLTRTIEGDAVYTAFSRSPQTGWAVAVGIPEPLMREAATRTLAAYGGGLLLSLGLGLLAAFFIGRQVTIPMSSLRAAARTLGRRETPVVAPTRVAEIREVGNALIAASEERARSESQRERLLRGEQEARAAAERANRSKDEFVSVLSHELRNPIAAIANAARLLETENLERSVAIRAREVIGRQAAHLGRLADDLLTAEAAVQGRIVLQRRHVDLAGAARTALDSLPASRGGGSHRVTTQLTQVWVDADPLRLEQIIARLLDNAFKFTPDGGFIYIATSADAGEAVLLVKDSGIGMTAELSARVFELFEQADAEPQPPQGGLGIGLTLVRRLAELHGGSASARSAGPGMGSEFEVRLPRARTPAPAGQAAPMRPTQQARDVLVVEDHEDARAMLRFLLEAAGHRVRVARDGLEGVQAALADRPDIALIDIGLPRIDGYEVARRIRAATAPDARPFLVAITGYGLPADKARAMAAGFDAHLVKPIDHGALESILARL